MARGAVKTPPAIRIPSVRVDGISAPSANLDSWHRASGSGILRRSPSIAAADLRRARRGREGESDTDRLFFRRHGGLRPPAARLQPRLDRGGRGSPESRGARDRPRVLRRAEADLPRLPRRVDGDPRDFARAPRDARHRRADRDAEFRRLDPLLPLRRRAARLRGPQRLVRLGLHQLLLPPLPDREHLRLQGHRFEVPRRGGPRNPMVGREQGLSTGGDPRPRGTSPAEQVHNALHDAQFQARILAALLDWKR